MNKIIFLQQSLAFALLVVFTSSAWSYGGGGGEAGKCKKPAFKDMNPPQSSEVSPGAEFSFTASSNTNPQSIKVAVKGHPVDLKLKTNGSIKVTGNLPAEVTEGYARINISATSSGSCAMQDGWLLKIGTTQPETPASSETPAGL
ncbi:MAG: hypothetical protein ACRERS_05300 [Methylococcales bacterium]